MQNVNKYPSTIIIIIIIIIQKVIILQNIKIEVQKKIKSNKLTESLFFFISNSIHYSLPSTYSICYPLSSTCFSLTGPSSGGLIVHAACGTLSPPLQMSLSCGRWSRNGHTTKTSAEGAECHRLHVQFRPPDDGPVRLKHVEERG